MMTWLQTQQLQSSLARIKKKIISRTTTVLGSLKATLQLDKQARAEFGIQFPPEAEKGDLFVRVDNLPNKLYKFNGDKWIEISKDSTTTYLTNDEYIEYLVDEIAAKKIDIDDLTPKEQEQVTKVMTWYKK